MTDPLTLETVCRDWHGLRRLALRLRQGPEFDRLIARARDGEEAAGQIAALLDLPAPDPEDTSARDVYKPFPGGHGQVSDGLYTCPGGICSREVSRGPSMSLPYCGVHGLDMEFSPTLGPDS